jgi:uncharacterized protein (DUF2147 family)
MKRILTFAAAGLATLATAATANASAPVEGYWRSPKSTVVIHIAPCGGRQLCGTVTWANENAKRNASKHISNLIGARLLTGLTGGPTRYSGKVWIPDQDIHATAKVQVLNEQRLQVSGCVFFGLLCKSQVWPRVDGPTLASR